MAAKLVQGERKRKFICSFPSRRLIKNYVKHRLKFLKPSGEQNKWIYFFSADAKSVGCDEGTFRFLEECYKVILLQCIFTVYP